MLHLSVEETLESIIIDVVGFEGLERKRTKLHTIDIFQSSSKIRLLIRKSDVLGKMNIERDENSIYISFGKLNYDENIIFRHVSYEDIIVCDLANDEICGIEII